MAGIVPSAAASDVGMCRYRSLLLVALLLVAASPAAPAPAFGEITLPPGFSARVYVSGAGFESGSTVGSGIPTTTTAAIDHAGGLYLARTGRRYSGGEIEDLWPIYRVAPGGARLTPNIESRFLYGPPLWSPQVFAARGGRELFVTTFDRDRKVGALYRLLDGRTQLLAGGTPPAGAPPLLQQPEGAAADAAGNVYVADRLQGVVVKLDASGRVLDPRHIVIARPRLLAVDDADQLWVGSDTNNEAPWQRGPGEIWKVSPQGAPTLVLSGPLPAGMGVRPGGRLFVADRHAAKIFFIAPNGAPVDFATFTEGDAPRTLCFAPETPETRRAGIAGDLFVVAVRRGLFRLNEVIHITGPFDDLLGRPTPPSR
jgi:DNA-binding beta-propeller fold protein YncE